MSEEKGIKSDLEQPESTSINLQKLYATADFVASSEGARIRDYLHGLARCAAVNYIKHDLRGFRPLNRYLEEEKYTALDDDEALFCARWGVRAVAHFRDLPNRDQYIAHALVSRWNDGADDGDSGKEGHVPLGG